MCFNMLSLISGREPRDPWRTLLCMERFDEYCNSRTESRTELGNGQVEFLVISERTLHTVDPCMFYDDTWFRFTLLVAL